MGKYINILLFVAIPFLSHAAVDRLLHDNSGQDVFVPLSKYITEGEAQKLAAWFAPTVEIDVFGKVNECSKSQAVQILESFFNEYTPSSFYILHKSGRAPMKYAIGNLDAGGEKFRVTIFMKVGPEGNYLQQLRIERE